VRRRSGVLTPPAVCRAVDGHRPPYRDRVEGRLVLLAGQIADSNRPDQLPRPIDLSLVDGDTEISAVQTNEFGEFQCTFDRRNDLRCCRARGRRASPLPLDVLFQPSHSREVLVSLIRKGLDDEAPPIVPTDFHSAACRAPARDDTRAVPPNSGSSCEREGC
jgi:hypothetical protein